MTGNSQSAKADQKWTTLEEFDIQMILLSSWRPRGPSPYLTLEVHVESPQHDLSRYYKEFADYLSNFSRFISLSIHNRGLHLPPIIAAICNLTWLRYLVLTLGEIPDNMDLSMLEDVTLEQRKLCTVTLLEGSREGYPVVYARAIAGLLRASSGTITSLKLPAEGVQQFFGGDVHFSNLEELHIWTDMMATNPCFTITQPKLRTLVLLVRDTSFFDDKQALESLAQRLPSLVRLIVDFRYPSWAPNVSIHATVVCGGLTQVTRRRNRCKSSQHVSQHIAQLSHQLRGSVAQ
ncbi:hypothetical protein EIP86_002399 [Pleurotus ostreatoroseus]|nr:hypothetical protein EIP86_002399 [Pleurotus ostreatoroseus]